MAVGAVKQEKALFREGSFPALHRPANSRGKPPVTHGAGHGGRATGPLPPLRLSPGEGGLPRPRLTAVPLPCPGRWLLGLTLRLLLLRLDTSWGLLVLVLGVRVGPADVRILSRSLLMISLVVVMMVMRSVVALGRCNTAGTIIFYNRY